MPIGGIQLPLPEGSVWEKWRSVELLLTAPLSSLAINVVCSLPGRRMGETMTEADLGPEIKEAGSDSLQKPNEVVYTPKSPFASLHTPSMRNIAITHLSPDTALGDEEGAALRLYDAVVAPSARSCSRLWDLDIQATPLHPTQTAGLASLVESLRTWDGEEYNEQSVSHPNQ